MENLTENAFSTAIVDPYLLSWPVRASNVQIASSLRQPARSLDEIYTNFAWSSTYSLRQLQYPFHHQASAVHLDQPGHQFLPSTSDEDEDEEDTPLPKHGL